MLPPWLRNLDTLRELREIAAKALAEKYSGPIIEETHCKEGRPKTRKVTCVSVRTILLPEEPGIRMAEKAS